MYDFGAIAQKIDMVHFAGITLSMNDTVRGQMKTLAREVKANGEPLCSIAIIVPLYGDRPLWVCQAAL